MTAHNAVDLTGQRFGFLTALHREGRQRTNALWRCRCDCGQEIRVRVDWLRAGRKKACRINGHIWRMPGAPTLQMRFSSEYRSWRNMHERCRDKTRVAYGGRGIQVCARWDSFDLFLKDMGAKPAFDYTIDRKNVNKGYEPKNCRWATKNEQRRNMRCSVFVEYEGERMLLLDVVAKLGLNRNVVYQRLKLGWPLEEALSVPVRVKKTKK